MPDRPSRPRDVRAAIPASSLQDTGRLPTPQALLLDFGGVLADAPASSTAPPQLVEYGAGMVNAYNVVK